MAVIKSPCEACGSQNNLTTFDNGSVWCFTPSCKSNNGRTKHVIDVNGRSEELSELNSLVPGTFSAIPARRLSQKTCEFFNYSTGVHNGKPVQIANYNGCQKLRYPDKSFQWVGNTKNITLYGKEKWSNNSNSIIITEGECYPPEVQVLTQDGWKYFPDVLKSDNVAQVYTNNTIDFVRPSKYIKKEINDDLVLYESGSYKGITTKLHKIVRKKDQEFLKVEAIDISKKHIPIPRVGILNTTNKANLTDAQLRLLIMVSADFTIRKEGDIYGCFKKERKYKRCLEILKSLNLRFSDTLDCRNYHSIFIHRKQNLEFCSKLFDHSLLGQLNIQQINVILNEVVHWDGNSVPNRNQIEYSTKELANATFIQTLSHLNGCIATIIPRKNLFGSWYKVSILFNKVSSSTQKGFKLVPYKGKVYCLTVPTGMLLVRYKNSISIGGNCDALSVAEAQDCKWPVVSLPNGAQSARKILQSELDWLLGFKTIILCFDNDDAGRLAIESCTDLFPPGKLKIAHLSEKDASDCLVKGKFEELAKISFNAAPYRPDGIVWGDEINVEELFMKRPRGLSLPYPLLDEAIRGLKSGRIYTIYAGTGNGKSTSMREIALHIRRNHPESKIANIFLEESLGFTALSFIAMENNIPCFKVEETPSLITSEQREKGKELIKDMGFYRHFGSLDSKHLFNLLDYIVVAEGVKVIFLDHISLLVSGMKSESGEGERRDIDLLLTNLRSFCERTQAIIVCATQLKRKQGSYNQGQDITEADARGSGAIEHISDVVFSLNCDNDSDTPNDAQIRILKNRITGFKGNADLITYDNKTGRYLPKKLNIQGEGMY